jgi:hypothetical protein
MAQTLLGASSTGDPQVTAPTLLARAAALGKAGDVDGAFQLTHQAALAGEPGAWTSLGNLHAKGAGTKRSKVDAAQCYKRARRAGDAKGAGLLAMCIITGTGVGQSQAEGMDILLDVARGGDYTAVRNCTWIYRYGEKYGVRRDDDAARRWMIAAQAMRATRPLALVRTGSLPALRTNPKYCSEGSDAGFQLTDASSSATLFAAPEIGTLTAELPASPPSAAPAPRGDAPAAPSALGGNRSSDGDVLGNDVQLPAAPPSMGARGKPSSTSALSSMLSNASSLDSRTSSTSQGQRRPPQRPPPPLSRRQSMATLLNPLNSMVQPSKRKPPSQQRTAPAAPPPEDAREAEDASPALRAQISTATAGRPPPQSTDALLPKSTSAEHVPQGGERSAAVIVNLGSPSYRAHVALSPTERIVVQCDVRHVGIPLGCVSFAAMWRAMALNFQENVSVDFEAGRVPLFAHSVEYAMCGMWFSVWYLTAAVYLTFTSIYAYRSVRHRNLLLQDFEDPVLTNFFAAIAIVGAVLTIAVPPPIANGRAIEAAFFVLLAYKVFLSVGFWYTDWLFSTGHNSLRRTSPIYFMAVINLFLLSNISATIGIAELAIFLFLLGSLMWLIVFTTSFSFIAKTYEHGVDKPSPTLFCFLAPYVPHKRRVQQHERHALHGGLEFPWVRRLSLTTTSLA